MNSKLPIGEMVLSLPPEVQCQIFNKMYNIGEIILMISILKNSDMELDNFYNCIERIDIGNPSKTRDYGDIAQYLNTTFLTKFKKLKEINVNLRINYTNINEGYHRILNIIEHPMIMNFNIECFGRFSFKYFIELGTINEKIIDNLLRRYSVYSKGLINIFANTNLSSLFLDDSEKYGFNRGIFYPSPVSNPTKKELEILSKIEIDTIINPTSIKYATLPNIKEIKIGKVVELLDFLIENAEYNPGGTIKEIDFDPGRFSLYDKDHQGISPNDIFYDKTRSSPGNIFVFGFSNITKFSTTIHFDPLLVKIWRYSFPNIKEFVFYNAHDKETIDEYNRSHHNISFIITNKK
jgi:hypothetical protein